MSTEKLNVGDFGDEVARLQEKLKANGFEVSTEEVKRKFFGPATRDAVRECQTCHGLDATGKVDDATASVLLTPVAGSFVHPAATMSRPPKESPSRPLSPEERKTMKLITPPLRQNDQGEDVVNLQECLFLLLGKHVIKASDEERRYLEEGLKREQLRQVFTDFTAKLVGQFQEQYSTQFRLAVTGEVDAPTADALNRFLKELGAVDPEQEGAVYEVNGKVASRSRAGVGGLHVVIVDKNVGADVQLKETVTDDGGTYQITFPITGLQERCKQRPDLQARAFSGVMFLGASEVRYNASNRETLNILLTTEADSALPSEHETLIGALTSRCLGNLRDLQETDERQDITYLANKTGWDARAVALAALADQFSARTMDANGHTAIEPAFFYALFRAGLPANEDALYQTDAKTAEAIWKQAIAQGVIPASLEGSLPQTRDQFQSLAVRRALETPALAGVSSLKEMLSVSLGDDPARQQQFAALYTEHRAEPDKLWAAVRDNLGEVVEKRLRLDGQLSYLTLNNAPLIQKLHQTVNQGGLSQPLDLVGQGYHRTDKWKDLIGDEAIPLEISGKDEAAKRANYGEMMAAQVRLSFPTAVVAEVIKGIDTPAANLNLAHNFLKEHLSKFEIGTQPVEQYISRNNLQIAEEVTQAVKKVQRVYQITPSDSAMTGLLKKGVDSAYAVTLYDQDEFIRTFKDDIGGEENALLTYAKAQQVHNTVLNIATSYLIARTAPPIGVHSPPQIIDQAPKVPDNAGDVIAYPDLESLFGEMDYCACEHCRSILSPAAYLVNLLQFIDLKRYTPQGIELPATYKGTNPLDVLLEHRPDIQHLPLTCENTNTPLPYIDLVNETLEYFVFNKLSLKKYAGHDTTGDATPDELLAGPQHGDTEASVEAYKILAAAHFPPPLPFHQPLENLRRYFDRFEAPLPEVMEALRRDDSLERANANEYGWRDILMEELRLSRTEYTLLSDHHLILRQIYEYPEATPEDDVLTDLSNAKAFTRRVGISYEDIIEILRTRFVNPNSTLIPKLERLGVPFATLKTLRENPLTGQAWLDLLPKPLPDASQYGGNIEAWVKNDDNYARIMSLITLANPSGAEDICSFDKLEFRYSDPDKLDKPIRAFEFYRFIRFIRLWKKLGWTIEQTDKAIIALYPADQTPNDADDTVNLQRLDAGFLVLLPRLGVIKRMIDFLKLKSKTDLLPLLTCFAPIDTHGAVALYRQMFLRPALLKQDPAFADNGYGNFLTDNAQKLMAHAEALRAAFQLTGDELSQIIAELSYDAGTPLTLDTISALFRRGWLARKLKLSVREFLLLTRFTGLDPFAAPDAPNPAILRLIEIVTRLRAASLKPVQALYLIWNQDISGKSSPDGVEVLEFGRTLRAGFAAIENEFAVVDDPDGQIARARMALVYDNDTTDRFFGLLDEKTVTDVSYPHIQATLEKASMDVGQKKIAYDNLRKRLSYAGGVLPDTIRDALKAVPEVTQAFKDAVDGLHKKSRTLFDRFPELQPLHNAYVASNDPANKKRSDLLAALLCTLKPRRKRQQALQAISAAVKTDIGFAGALLDNKLDGKYVLHATGDVNQPVLNDLTALETPGLSARFFFRDTASGTVDHPSDAEAILDYSSTAKDKPKLPANGGNPISGVWSGYLEAPENGFYNFHIETDPGATVTLMFADQIIDLVGDGKLWSNKDAVELKAGTLLPISLKVEKVRDMLTMRWETLGRGREVIPARHLYSGTLTARLLTTYVRFLKAISLAEALKLTASELVHFVSHADYSIDTQGWLNSLPVLGNPDEATSTVLFKGFMALLDFARLKADLSPDDERLFSVLRNPEALVQDLSATADKPELLLFSLTRWEPDSLDALLVQFGKVRDSNADRSALKDLTTFSRVYTACLVMKTLGIPASALIKAATNEPNAIIVRDLQAALRARYEENDWLNVLKPINDELRALQRDALVAYILHRMRADPQSAHIDTPDKLFEYFLMDVQMAPCMQTSRIRHVLSSVQLFIERCLMNLVPQVASSSIKAKQWEWMRRYRVWEANRKVFLWPENWLEPELRDNQSPFFKETMSELLQGDITEDRAAVALLNYLSKLEEVAKLEPCGIHYVENDPSKREDDIAHVVARTAGANRKYFYRRREPSGWTPWEQIKLDIEDNPVIPVVWKGRLFLFWLRIIKQTPLDIASQAATPAPKTNPSDPKSREKNFSEMSLSEAKGAAKEDAKRNIALKVQAVLCWSEYYNGKWQPTKTSDVNRPTMLGQFSHNAFDRSKLWLRVFEDKAGELRIFIRGDGSGSFLLYNTHSLPIRGEDTSIAFGHSGKHQRRLSTENDVLVISYDKFQPGVGMAPDFTRDVLKNHIYGDQAIEPRHFLKNPWDAPFFYEDRHHVFFVSMTEQPLTIPKWIGYLPITILPKSDLTIPPLVLEKVHIIPDLLGPVIFGQHMEVVNTAQIERFISEDAYIKKGISTTDTVLFGSTEITAAGNRNRFQQR